MRIGVLLAAVVIAGTVTAAGAQTHDEALLAAHNVERARVGVAALTWDGKLTADASAWANTIAKTGKFKHAKNLGPDGENLWMGTKDSFTPTAMVEAWIAERQFYKAGRYPNVSTTGDDAAVGHFTQLIWSTTTKVGCAIASNAENDYLVCRYNPGGNMAGEPAIPPEGIVPSP